MTAAPGHGPKVEAASGPRSLGTEVPGVQAENQCRLGFLNSWLRSPERTRISKLRPSR